MALVPTSSFALTHQLPKPEHNSLVHGRVPDRGQRVSPSGYVDPPTEILLPRDPRCRHDISQFGSQATRGVAIVGKTTGRMFSTQAKVLQRACPTMVSVSPTARGRRIRVSAGGACRDGCCCHALPKSEGPSSGTESRRVDHGAYESGPGVPAKDLRNE